MKKTLLFIALCSLFNISQLWAQENAKEPIHQDEQEENNLYLGLGFGLDYGGIGARLEILPLPFIGFFGAAGYNLNGLGFNGGISAKLLPDEPFTPTIQAMYGYNAVAISGRYHNGKTYYGPSIGLGVDGKFGRNAHKLFATINYPFRNRAFKDDFSGSGDVFPVTFSLGFNFSIYVK